MTTLKSKRLTLRAWRLEDEIGLLVAANDAKTNVNMREPMPSPFTRQDAKRWLARTTGQHEPLRDFAITLYDVVIGGITLAEYHDSQNGSELSYWLADHYWNHDVAADAVRLTADYALRTLSLRFVRASVLSTNRVAAQVLERAEFSLLESSLEPNGASVKIFSKP